MATKVYDDVVAAALFISGVIQIGTKRKKSII